MIYTQHPLSTEAKKEKTGTSVYVIFFSNNRIKVGITKNFKKRMSAYSQEVKRNGIEFASSFGCIPFINHQHALRLERHICSELSASRINKQREWFSGDAGMFKCVLDVIQDARLMLSSPDEDKEEIEWRGFSATMEGVAS